jgi:CheY-like chemotaxis protein
MYVAACNLFRIHAIVCTFDPNHMTNPPPSLHILLADDDEEDQELIKDAIIEEAPGAHVTTVGNGEQALSYLADHGQAPLPGLIMLDYKMPILNGVETLDRLAGDSRFSSIPVVVWSTSNRQEYIDICLAKGATRFFTKPNDPQELRRIIASLLSLIRGD